MRARHLLPVVLLSSLGCSDRDLFVPQELRDTPIDNKLKVSGGFCAEGAQALDSYLKVMFIIDRSNSMNVTDPNNNRVSAVQNVVMRFIEDPVTYKLRAGVEFALISFYGDTVVHTRDQRGLPGFTNDGANILYQMTQLSQTGSNTGYDKALAQAFILLDTDMARLKESAKKRSRYEVIFLSDGMPFPDNCRGESNSPSAAVAATRRLKALQSLHDVQLTVSTAFASDPRMFTDGNDVDTCQDSDGYESLYNNSLGEETQALLRDMATQGGGTFRQFQNGDAISFDDFEFAEARRLYALSNFVAANHSSLPAVEVVAPDSDGDGLTDEDERRLGTRPTLYDSDGDGFGDALEWRFRQSGLDPMDPTDGQCTEVDRIDTDGDGLLDCEEVFLGTSRRSVDSDADGLPDPVELLLDSDAESAGPLADSQTDSDADGGTNAEEVRWHTDPRIDDIAERSKIAYDYAQTERPLTDGQACYDFQVSNISLASTQAALAEEDVEASRHQAGWNRVMLYFAETPYDEPLGDPLYRVACVDARFVAERDLKFPASGSFTIPRERPSDTYRPAPTRRPSQDVCQASVNQDCGLDTLWCRFEDGGACNCYAPPRDPQNTTDVDGTLIGACPACSDGIDNDGDGASDFPYDPDCFDTLDSDEASGTLCSNGDDDDGDGLADWPRDPGCADAYDGDEADPGTLPECADGADNDDDGTPDWPGDPGCDAASDDSEAQSLTTPVYACDDGLDNDGDGLVDMLDLGCFDANDIDEDGPQTCFFCETFTDNRPGQCDLGAGYCKPRGGTPPAGACTTTQDCRGAPCVDGACVGCLKNNDCDTSPGAGDGVCEAQKGWCLQPAADPSDCAGDGDCTGGSCDPDLHVCSIDPRLACRDERDCAPDEFCSGERGFCLKSVYAMAQCDDDLPCAVGRCDTELGFCLPEEEDVRCRHNDECPLGDCTADGYCKQQTFVFPENFQPDVDCLRAR